MSRSKAPLPSRETPRNLSDKTRTTSNARRDNAVSKAKSNVSENMGGPQSSAEGKPLSRQKQPPETSTMQSKDSINKVLSVKKERGSTDRGRETVTRQSKTTTSKSSTMTSAVKNPTALKIQSDPNVRTRGLKEQPKSVTSTKPTQATSKTKLKGNEVTKTSPRNSDQPRAVLQHTIRRNDKPSLLNKSSVPNTNVPSKSERKVKDPGTKQTENSSGDGSRLNRERTKTRTLNPEDSQLMTALQHAAQQLPQDVDPETTSDAENDYEDDFEDYESDFEEAPSVEVSSEEESDEQFSKSSAKKNDDDDDDDKENYDYGDSSSSLSDLQTTKDMQMSVNGKSGIEEKKMDSGHYDLAEERRLSGKAMSTILDSNTHIMDREILPLKDIRSKETSQIGNSYEVKPINFAQAKRRQKERKASSKLKHRGEILLNMIRLDSVSFSLFDMAPVPYEIYMSSYGRSNTQQVSCQTNEDGMNEEVQTDEINLKNKWTQHPPPFVRPDDTVDHALICAVSSDPCDPDDMVLWKQSLKVDVLELENFILNSGQLMLSILEETSSGAQGLLKKNKVDIGFSQGFVILGTESVPFLKDRKVSKLCFMPRQPNSVLSVHLSSKEVNSNDDLAAQMVKRCLLCLWSLLQPSKPLKILVSSSDVTACTFHPLRPHLLFTGLSDGLLSVWDLKEQTSFQSKVPFQDEEWTLKSPSYATMDQSGIKHSSAVVGVLVIDSASDSPSKSSELSPTQICSLDESGLCLIWTLLNTSTGIEDVGIAPWASMRLLQNDSFSLAQRVSTALDGSLRSNLQFTDLALDSADPGHLLASANTGHVAHCLSSGSRAHPAVYEADWDCLSPATCICPSPFGLPYFLVGCDDGTIRLHSRHSARPLLSVSGSGSAIANIQWSNSRPCVFFALDCSSRLHVWDLAASDMYPVLSVPFKGKNITSMQLSPTPQSAKTCPYLALGTACGRLKVHLVKDNLASMSPEDTAEELDKFKRYVSIL